MVFEKFGCADTFVPLILIENSQQQRQTGKAIESFRNEIVVASGQLVAIASARKQVTAGAKRRVKRNAAG